MITVGYDYIMGVLRFSYYLLGMLVLLRSYRLGLSD
jgi:hypothetical protein